MKKIIMIFSGILLVFLSIVLVLNFILSPATYTGSDIQEIANKNTMLINRISKSFDRGDIIAFNYITTHGTSVTPKRIIGLPNEHITFDNGALYINNEPFVEEYAYGQMSGRIEVDVPEDSYLVMGDNRGNFTDPAMLVPQPSIIGIVITCINLPENIVSAGLF